MATDGRRLGGRLFRSRERAFVWCFVRTAQDWRTSCVERRAIASRNLYRLLLRRLGDLLQRPVEAEELDRWIALFLDERWKK
jgi:hypothetical protein